MLHSIHCGVNTGFPATNGLDFLEQEEMGGSFF